MYIYLCEQAMAYAQFVSKNYKLSWRTGIYLILNWTILTKYCNSTISIYILLKNWKVENFQLQNFFPTEKFVSANHILQNFLSAENFPEWKSALRWFRSFSLRTFTAHIL
jgi:hypothetical protein